MAGTEHKAKTPLGGVSAFQCKNCGGQIELRAPGQTMRAGCVHCGAVIDLTNPNFKVLHRYKQKIKYRPVIQLGRRGMIDGIQWEVIGFQVRKVVGYPYQWEEYLLFNPYHGFRWILNQYGHWSFTKPLLEYPENASKNGLTMRHEGKVFKAFSKGRAEVLFVFGEFYWEVKRGENVKTYDLVNAPEMLSAEFDETGKNWTRSRYIEPKEIQKIFGSDIKLPPKKGIASHQPNKWAARVKSVLPIYLIAVALLIIGQLYLYSPIDERVITVKGKVDELPKDTPPDPNGKEVVSEPFELPGSTGNVEIILSGPNLRNSWLETEGYIRNVETKKVHEFRMAAEYYYGYEGGEHWSEGSRVERKVINLVPGGKYELVAQLYAGKSSLDYSIGVARDVPITSNFFLILGLISLPVFYWGFMSNSFNKKKWADSDFN